MSQKTVTPNETEAQPAAKVDEQPRRLGLKVRSRVRAGFAAGDVNNVSTDEIAPTETRMCTAIC